MAKTGSTRQPKTGRQLFRPKLKELPEQCASCPFKDGNDKEWGDVHKRLAAASGVEKPLDPRISRWKVRDEIINGFSGDFFCHGTAYNYDMTRRPMSEARQCPGATKLFVESDPRSVVKRVKNRKD